MNWLRLYHGTSSNPKLAMIANKAGARPCEMTAFWLCLLEHASQQKPRGSVESIDLELIAFSQGIDAETLHRLYKGLEEKRVIVDGRIVSWDEYQYAHDPTAAERKRRQRKNDKSAVPDDTSTDHGLERHDAVTPCHDAVTECHAPDRDTDSEQKAEHSFGLDKSNPPALRKKAQVVNFDSQVGSFSNIPDAQFQVWLDAYPAVNVQLELQKATAWLMANPKHKKSNYLRFINNWLNRAQDKSRPANGFLSNAERKDIAHKQALASAARELGLIDDEDIAHVSKSTTGFLSP